MDIKNRIKKIKFRINTKLSIINYYNFRLNYKIINFNKTSKKYRKNYKKLYNSPVNWKNKMF